MYDMEESKKLIMLKSKLVVLLLAQSLLIRLGKERVLWKEAAASVIRMSLNPDLRYLYKSVSLWLSYQAHKSFNSFKILARHACNKNLRRMATDVKNNSCFIVAHF